MISPGIFLPWRDDAIAAGDAYASSAATWVDVSPDDVESILCDVDPEVLDRYAAPALPGPDVLAGDLGWPDVLADVLADVMADAYYQAWEDEIGGKASCAADWHEWRHDRTGATCERCGERGERRPQDGPTICPICDLVLADHAAWVER